MVTLIRLVFALLFSGFTLSWEFDPPTTLTLGESFHLSWNFTNSYGYEGPWYFFMSTLEQAPAVAPSVADEFDAVQIAGEMVGIIPTTFQPTQDLGWVVYSGDLRVVYGPTLIILDPEETSTSPTDSSSASWIVGDPILATAAATTSTTTFSASGTQEANNTTPLTSTTAPSISQTAPTPTDRPPTNSITPAKPSRDPLQEESSQASPQQSPQPQPHPRLSTAALAGILVSATLTFSLLASVVIYLFRRRHQLRSFHHRSSSNRSCGVRHADNSSASETAAPTPLQPQREGGAGGGFRKAWREVLLGGVGGGVGGIAGRGSAGTGSQIFGRPGVAELFVSDAGPLGPPAAAVEAMAAMAQIPGSASAWERECEWGREGRVVCELPAEPVGGVGESERSGEGRKGVW